MSVGNRVFLALGHHADCDARGVLVLGWEVTDLHRP